MIPNFPTPFKDELFHSWIARYQWVMMESNYKRTMRMLFSGGASTHLAPELPSRLDQFVANLGASALDPDNIIRNHTLLPAHAPFMSHEKVHQIQTMMKTRAQGALLLRGTGVLSVSAPSFLRFCPLCSQEERRSRGEAYWHRLHQIAGVLVCPVHNVFLEQSSAPFRAEFRFNAAETFITDVAPKPLDSCEPDHSFLKRISQGAAWLLDNWSAGNDFDWLGQRYRQLALKHGFLSNRGRILWNNLLAAFEERYSKRVLDWLQCRVSETPSVRECNWIVHILGGVNYVQAPIRHLLLMDLFGVDISQFFDPQAERPMLGTEFRKCDNPVCPKHAQFVVRVTYKYDARMKGARAHLSCTVCGKERLEGRRPGRGRIHVKTYGPIWDSKLRDLLTDGSIPLQRIPCMLGVRTRVVRQEAARLGLRSLLDPWLVAGTSAAPRAKGDDYLQNRRIQMQQLWLSLRSEHPSASRSELRRAYPRYYNWLRRYHREWFELNTPPRITFIPPMRRKHKTTAEADNK